MTDPDVITETDIAETEPTVDELVFGEDFEHERDYWAEVRECCGGTDPTCGHYRHYPPFLQEVEP